MENDARFLINAGRIEKTTFKFFNGIHIRGRIDMAAHKFVGKSAVNDKKPIILFMVLTFQNLFQL